MKIPVKSYQIRCDGCGELFETEEGYTCYCDDPNHLETSASESDWLITSDDHHYCPNCWQWDDNDICRTMDGRMYDENYEPINVEEAQP